MNALFCQVSIDHNIDVKKDVRCKPRLGIGCSMATTAMLTMKKELHGFLFLCMHVILFLKLWCSAIIIGIGNHTFSSSICNYFATVSFSHG